MALVICPGAHSPAWTTQFLRQLDEQMPEGRDFRFIFPAPWSNPWSPHALRKFLDAQAIALNTPLVFVAFSAGCVAAAGTAWYGVQRGRQILAIIALDGWGVPITGPFASYRLSHDAFTHHTSAYLGAGKPSFYADPSVPHQQLWCNPAGVEGQQVGAFSTSGDFHAVRTTALQFLIACLRQHPEAFVNCGACSPTPKIAER